MVKKYQCTDVFIINAVNEYSDTVYRVAYNITNNTDDAFDVCQEVFLRLVKNSHKIKNEDHLKAWILRVAVNCARSYAKRKNRFESKVVENEIFYTESNEKLELLEAVMALPEKYRIVVHLFYYEDLKVEQIAEVLKINKSAVKTRLCRAREKLKNML